ncbi:MAG: amidohydrolase [Spirochaetaceae bacterium]|jgi:amidohydrolase|nr:amidohydrolase [Spirochaetaceae bacterium]
MNEKQYPLSGEQLKYYTYWSMTGRSFMMPIMLRFGEDADIKRLGESYLKCLNAHVFLKANIKIIDGVPYWQRHDSSEITVKVIDLTHEEFEKTKDAFYERHEMNPDITKDPLYFAEIYRVDARDVYIVMVFNHILYDGFTHNIILDDLIRAYNAEDIENDQKFGFEEGNVEIAYKQSESFHKTQEFYDALFSHYKGELKLSKAPNDSDCTGVKIVNAFLDSEELRAFLGEKKISPNIIFLAALCDAAHAVSGEEYIFLSTETAGRAKRQLEREAGLFVRNFPLGFKVDKKLKGIQFVKSIEEQYYNILKNHSGYTSETAVEKHGFKINFNYLYQADVYNFKPNYPEPKFREASNELISRIKFIKDAVIFDCDVQIHEFPIPQLEYKPYYWINIKYSGALYSESFMQSFVNTMRGFIEDLYKENINCESMNAALLLRDYTTSIRRKIHEYPELGFKEFKTTELIEQELKSFGIPCRRALETGIIGEFVPENAGTKTPCIAFRADIDALPISEKVESPFKSRNDGIMHACGHDAHAAMLLSLAKYVSEHKDKVKCGIKFIFQPGEETLYGARNLLEKNPHILDGVDEIIALHVVPTIYSGKIFLRPGQVTSFSDRFHIKILGKMAHGAMPEASVDALYIASLLVNAMQSLSSRRVSPNEPVVVSVGTFHAGTAPNIIAGTAELSGTVRCASAKTRDFLEKEIENTVKSIVAIHPDAKYEFEYTRGLPPVINAPGIYKKALGAAKKALGEKNVISPETDDSDFHTGTLTGIIKEMLNKAAIASDDFAFYAEKKPSCYCYLLAGYDGKFPYTLHNENMTISDNALTSGTAFLISYIS